MPRLNGIAQILQWAVLVAFPALAVAQAPPGADRPEPPLEPMPGTQAPRGDRLPPLEPMPSPDDEPRIPPPRPLPVRPQAEPTPPSPETPPPPPAEQVMPVPQPGTVEVPPSGTVVEGPAVEMIEEDEVVVAGDAGATIVGASPTPGLVWVPGQFRSLPATTVYVPGRWEKPLIGAPRYVVGRYAQQPGRTVWVPGHWARPVSTPVVAPTSTAMITSAPTSATVVDPSVKVVHSRVATTPAVVGTTQVVTPTTVVSPTTIVTPAPAVIPGQWKRGFLGRWKYVPARVAY